jgi:hypothetical protein
LLNSFIDEYTLRSITHLTEALSGKDNYIEALADGHMINLAIYWTHTI